jgi:hypothetical protein
VGGAGGGQDGPRRASYEGVTTVGNYDSVCQRHVTERLGILILLCRVRINTVCAKGPAAGDNEQELSTAIWPLVSYCSGCSNTCKEHMLFVHCSYADFWAYCQRGSCCLGSIKHDTYFGSELHYNNWCKWGHCYLFLKCSIAPVPRPVGTSDSV